jgi:hypothetical protein
LSTGPIYCRSMYLLALARVLLHVRITRVAGRLHRVARATHQRRAHPPSGI